MIPQSFPAVKRLFQLSQTRFKKSYATLKRSFKNPKTKYRKMRGDSLIDTRLDKRVEKLVNDASF